MGIIISACNGGGGSYCKHNAMKKEFVKIGSDAHRFGVVFRDNFWGKEYVKLTKLSFTKNKLQIPAVYFFIVPLPLEENSTVFKKKSCKLFLTTQMRGANTSTP
jgi:hypothetical protein